MTHGFPFKWTIPNFEFPEGVVERTYEYAKSLMGTEKDKTYGGFYTSLVQFLDMSEPFMRSSDLIHAVPTIFESLYDAPKIRAFYDQRELLPGFSSLNFDLPSRLLGVNLELMDPEWYHNKL